MNHDVMRRGQSAALAASAALARLAQEEGVHLPKRAEAKVEEICAARFLTDSGDIFENVLKAHLGYWKNYGVLRAALRKMGIGGHPFRQRRQGWV
jgi:GTP cyclohydrolase II